MSHPSLTDLPTELIILIFAHLPISDLHACLLTCCRFAATIQGSGVLQYLIQAHLAGVCDLLVSRPELPVVDRAADLRRWVAAWQQPAARETTDVADCTVEVWQGEHILHDDYLIAMDFGGRCNDRHEARYEWLDLRREEREWNSIALDKSVLVVGYGLDVSGHDLLALFIGYPESLTFEICLLQFHGGSLHPQAARPSISIELPITSADWVGMHAKLWMMGPYILVGITLPLNKGNDGDLLFLVDWRTGKLTKVTTSCAQTRAQFTHTLPKLRTGERSTLIHAIVLSPDTLALVQGPANTIELCRLDTTAPTPSLRTLGALELPPLLPDAKLFVNEPSRHPFRASADCALVLVSATASLLGSIFARSRRYKLVVHAPTLLAYAHEHVGAGARVPWAAWGPRDTRVFRGKGSFFSAALGGGRWLLRDAVRDFCPGRVRAAGGGEGPSVLPAAGTFACDVESALAYIEVPLPVHEDACILDAMIDAERVVEKVGESPTWREGYDYRVHLIGA
ncbi:hypothetical protein BC834DRAFT_971321 [Gloeopeniophorella convolvens]|nr:hypothetical protein BC834DRAFT_971321 [Gloeopeniophorella convolvens]